MRNWTTGPALRSLVERQCFDPDRPGGVKYEYIGSDGRRQPEYEATRIRIQAFHWQMSVAALGDLEAKLRSVPGCLSTERVEQHPTLRPQVMAVFDRAVAAPGGEG